MKAREKAVHSHQRAPSVAKIDNRVVYAVTPTQPLLRANSMLAHMKPSVEDGMLFRAGSFTLIWEPTAPTMSVRMPPAPTAKAVGSTRPAIRLTAKEDFTTRMTLKNQEGY